MEHSVRDRQAAPHLLPGPQRSPQGVEWPSAMWISFLRRKKNQFFRNKYQTLVCVFSRFFWRWLENLSEKSRLFSKPRKRTHLGFGELLGSQQQHTAVAGQIQLQGIAAVTSMVTRPAIWPSTVVLQLRNP